MMGTRPSARRGEIGAAIAGDYRKRGSIETWQHYWERQMTALTVAEFTDGKFYARVIQADAASGEITIPGRATDNDIREFANENLAAPYDGHGDYSDVVVVWE